MGDLTKNFSRWEFACKCKCGYDNIDPDLVMKLQHMRGELGRSITVDSGCRCPEHNLRVGGATHSEHMMGDGADIRVANTLDAYLYMRAAFNAGFQRLGFGKTKKGNLLMHVGVSTALPTPRLWGY